MPSIMLAQNVTHCVADAESNRKEYARELHGKKLTDEFYFSEVGGVDDTKIITENFFYLQAMPTLILNCTQH